MSRSAACIIQLDLASKFLHVECVRVCVLELHWTEKWEDLATNTLAELGSGHSVHLWPTV